MLSFLTAAPLADFATPLAPWGDMRVRHTWSAVPANWETLGCPSADTTIDLYIALNPHQENALIDALYEVSDPKHPRHVHLTTAPLAPSFTYGAHLSKGQVAELVRPHPDTLELVTSWLAHHGVRPTSISTTHGGAWLTVSNVLVSRANQMLGASYQLYRHAKVNDTIIRTVSYALPEVLHAHIQAVAPTTYFAPTQTLRKTLRRRSVEAAAASAETEAASDAVLESLEYILRKTDIPQTISISFGIDERKLPREYAKALCILFAQLGTRGVSVLVPSGDEGVGHGGNCKDESGNHRFAPEFPASCPYTTAIGGTTDYDPEVAAPISGGGFSDYFPRPVYQDIAVSAFLERQGTQYTGLYSPEGRGIPDIAAQALKFQIVVDDEDYVVGGTSCSTPLTINAQTVAGIISLLNDYLITNGRSPLGFLNIRLYDDGFAGLNDITSGSNPGCDTDGFPAVPGWDPVTGLGTPDFEKLQKIFMIPLGGGAGQRNQPKIRGPADLE
ncbi:peptidase S8/S53 domain-containing protein [Lactarius hengduanensis]|nr:peptidase S8/S53 domain-containing protein [Lactarius hengduanensis]